MYIYKYTVYGQGAHLLGRATGIRQPEVGDIPYTVRASLFLLFTG